jgi:hypothetical protein
MPSSPDERSSSAKRARVQAFPPPIVLIAAAGSLGYVAHIVAQHTIAIVEHSGLVPRWDLSTHLVLGWFDYHFLVSGRIHRLLWDVWLQGYWPPLFSIYQIPFYLVLGGRMRAGLWSSLAAFVLLGITGCMVLWREFRHGAVLGASLFLALLMSSPYLLAYASVAMTEMLGGLMQLAVVLCYVQDRQQPTHRSARLFAMSLTLLFFTKYNYFFLLVVPLVVHEWLERTSGERAVTRLASVGRWSTRILTSPTGVLLTLYFAALLILLRTGGFDLYVFGRRIAVHTIGNTGHVVLYVLGLRLWYLHRRGRIDWVGLGSADRRARPLLAWFVLPVAIWLASPYPNHIRDFANLVFNRPLGESTIGAGISTYVDVLRTSYFYAEWILLAAIGTFCIAALRYRGQSPWIQWLIVTIPFQFAAIAIHQTRFPRFLLLTVVLLCLVVSAEIASWFAGIRRPRLVTSVLSVGVLALGVAGARAAVTQDRFKEVAFENYTDNRSLRAALDSLRGELLPNDRLVIVGEGNELSPALFRWELGPPSGVACSPFQIGGASRLDLALATRVLLMEPAGAGPSALDVTSYYQAQRRSVLERVARGEFWLRREIELDDLHVLLRIYDRASKPDRLVACE